MPRPESAPVSLFLEDGSINEPVLQERFGLGIEEATQEVQFGGYTGTVAQMLSDEKCPVGGMVSSAFEQKGIEGVKTQFDMLSMMDPNFNVEIRVETIERNEVKKN